MLELRYLGGKTRVRTNLRGILAVGGSFCDDTRSRTA